MIKTPEEYGEFFIRTTEIIKKEQPDAFISGLVLCGMHRTSFDYITSFLEYLKKVGKLDLLDEMTYHPYPQAPEETYPLGDSLKTMIVNYSAKITIKHGETGCPAEFNKAGVYPIIRGQKPARPNGCLGECVVILHTIFQPPFSQ